MELGIRMGLAVRAMPKLTSVIHCDGHGVQGHVGRSSPFPSHLEPNMTGLCRLGGQLDSVFESTEQSGELHLFTSPGS